MNQLNAIKKGINNMEDATWAAFIIIVLLLSAFIFIGYLHYIYDTRCKDRYGNNWHYSYSRYGPQICVNELGEAKYL